MSIKVCQIVAMNQDRVIGVDNRLPWHLPADLQYFKRTTLGKPIVMGRKTWESLGRPLPGRENIVVTRQADFCAEGGRVCRSLEEGLSQAKALAEQSGRDEVMVIGGAQIYAESLPHCDRLYITEVDFRVEGDAFYPELDAGEWREVSRECYPPQSAEQPGHCFVVMDKTL